MGDVGGIDGQPGLVGKIGPRPHIHDPQLSRILVLNREDQTPTLLHAELLNLEAGESVIKQRIGLKQAETPVELVPPVVIFLQLDRGPRPHSSGWQQSSRTTSTVVKVSAFTPCIEHLSCLSAQVQLANFVEENERPD